LQDFELIQNNQQQAAGEGGGLLLLDLSQVVPGFLTHNRGHGNLLAGQMTMSGHPHATIDAQQYLT
jgi:hypothetical protein